MILTKQAIKEQIKRGKITISPFNERFLGPNGIDLHLGKNLYIMNLEYNGRPMNPKDDVSKFYKPFTMDETGMILYPGTFVLGVSVEHTAITQHVGVLEGNSTNGRMGFESHICAGMGDIGFVGHWTLELRATIPIIIYPGMPIGQLTFKEVKGEFEKKDLYGSKEVSYNNSANTDPWPVIPNLFKKPLKFFDFENDLHGFGSNWTLYKVVNDCFCQQAENEYFNHYRQGIERKELKKGTIVGFLREEKNLYGTFLVVYCNLGEFWLDKSDLVLLRPKI